MDFSIQSFIFKFMAEKFMVEKYGVEKSWVKMTRNHLDSLIYLLFYMKSSNHLNTNGFFSDFCCVKD